MNTHDDLARVRAFQALVDEGAAVEVRDWPFGRAVLSRDIPHVWDANYCRLDDSRGAPAGEVAAAATKVAEDAGMTHISIVAAEDEASRIGGGLAELGFEPTEHVTLILPTRPDQPAAEVGRASFDDVAGSRAELTLEFSPGNHELAAQLHVLDTRLEASIGGDWLVIREDDQILSRAWLLAADGVAQIEDVATTPAARGRGLASAVVSAAANAALDAGNDLVFIVADSDGNAQRLYRKLGFEPLGLSTRFVRARA